MAIQKVIKSLRPFSSEGAILSISLLAFGALVYQMTSSSSITGLLAIVLAFLTFLICLYIPLMGMALMLIAMMFSPEFRISGVILRVEELIIPILSLAIALRLMRKSGGGLRKSSMDLPILCVMAAHVISTIMGYFNGTVPLKDGILWNFKVLELFFIYWITFNLIRKPAHAKMTINVVILVLLGVTVYAISLIPTTQVHTIHRLTAPFEDTPEPTTLGGYFTIVSAIMLSFALLETSRPKKWFYLSIFLLIIPPILFTFSRTTYISFSLMILMLAIFIRHKPLMFIAVSALIFAPFLMPDAVRERMMMTFDSTRDMGLDPSFVERLVVWKKAANTLSENPIVGKGFPQPILDSQFARIIIESGLLGLAAWIFLLYRTVRLGLSLKNKGTEPRHIALGTGFTVATFALIIHALATISFYIVRIMEPFWFLAGLVASLEANARDERKRREEEELEIARRRDK